MREELYKEKRRIEENKNIQSALKLLEEYINRYGEVKTFDFLSKIMEESKPYVEILLQNKKEEDPQYDENQARKTIAGNNFQFLVLYLLIINIENGNLPENLIVLRTKQHKLIDEYATIKVADETQKPDIDLIAFSEEKNKPIVIYSCKTSLRERAGQTHRWKLLLDITQHCPILVEKYQLKYSKNREILTGFITADFYNEIMQPQQRGILEFFDFSYVAKDIQVSPPIKNLSKIIEDLNNLFS
jgi:type II restriction enzyme